MAPRDLLATVPSQGGDASSWSWYIPVALAAVVVAMVLASISSLKTLEPVAFVLFGLGFGALILAALAGDEEADKVVRSFADPVPQDLGQFLVMAAFVVLWNLFAKDGWRRRNDSDDSERKR